MSSPASTDVQWVPEALPIASHKPFRDPVISFAAGAFCFFVAAIPAWLLSGAAGTHSPLANLASQFCRGAAILGICAALYFLFIRIFRWKMSARLAQIHFWMSALGILLQPLLTYTFSQENAAVPGHSAFSLLMDFFVGATAASAWALLVFVLAQAVFILNIGWTLLRTLASITPGQAQD